MKLYQVFLDMSGVFKRLKKFNLGPYSSINPIIFVEAADPDEACYKALFSLVKRILTIDSSPKIKRMCDNLHYDIKILKVRTK